MFIERLQLKNFKCFQETDIEFSKITLLTGANSSGKSSVIQGILVPLQTNQFPFYLSPNGKYVNLGDYKEMVFGHDIERKISLNLRFVTQAAYYEENIKILTKWENSKTNKLPILEKITLNSKDRNGFLENVDVIKTSNKYDVFFTNEKITTEKVAVKHFSEIIDPRNSTTTYYKPVKWINMRFAAFSFNTTFLSSFRLAPERTYYQIAQIARVDKYGQGYIDQILEWEIKNAKEFNELTSILKELELLQAIKSNQLEGGRFELKLKTHNSNFWASLSDVGFGISQILPIIVADLQIDSSHYLHDESTLIAEQPEIHLHPSIQAALGDYFTTQATEKNKRYIIETHSEYLLNRIRLNIVKGKLQPEDVAVYYFENSPQGSQTHRIEFTKDGQIHNAPDGFFDTYMVDTMDIAMYA